MLRERTYSKTGDISFPIYIYIYIGELGEKNVIRQLIRHVGQKEVDFQQFVD